MAPTSSSPVRSCLGQALQSLGSLTQSVFCQQFEDMALYKSPTARAPVSSATTWPISTGAGSVSGVVIPIYGDRRSRVGPARC
ncbi:hypothetical protein MCOR25_008835 [Pyricularia grisea]|uniref:Uncharacterized protein n=1 Tax=Pyricularia grisea TaxID=148305 RepID=A0A6P8AUX3_PYRGI|nr:uncharacterized protein PgNI_08043 [Pyricularia grisea]KAI6353922.1 hypothetical protein MCOR25_008835 [Pyricularia grisea]TLD06021.1 hypothetical protein PgNI_08043 [Pyricularia grisea]